MTSRRWERWHVRPAQRSRASRPRRVRYTTDDMMKQFDVGIEVGREIARADPDTIAQVADAIRNDTLDDLAREVGVTPLDPYAVDVFVDDVTDWLIGQTDDDDA